MKMFMCIMLAIMLCALVGCASVPFVVAGTVAKAAIVHDIRQHPESVKPEARPIVDKVLFIDRGDKEEAGTE